MAPEIYCGYQWGCGAGTNISPLRGRCFAWRCVLPMLALSEGGVSFGILNTILNVYESHGHVFTRNIAWNNCPRRGPTLVENRCHEEPQPSPRAMFRLVSQSTNISPLRGRRCIWHFNIPMLIVFEPKGNDFTRNIAWNTCPRRGPTLVEKLMSRGNAALGEG